MIGSGNIAKYDSNLRTSTYSCVYDEEDVWYCLMMYEDTRKIIQNGRYRNLEDVIYRMDCQKLDDPIYRKQYLEW